MNEIKIIMNCDGSGSGCGGVLKDRKGNVISKYKVTTSNKTSNENEYLAVLEGLNEIVKIYDTVSEFTVCVLSDSKLVVNTLKGRWRIHCERLKDIREQIKKLSYRFLDIEYQWIPREMNTEADSLSYGECVKSAIIPSFSPQ